MTAPENNEKEMKDREEKKEKEESLFKHFERVLRHENIENIKDKENTDMFALLKNMFKDELAEKQLDLSNPEEVKGPKQAIAPVAGIGPIIEPAVGPGIAPVAGTAVGPPIEPIKKATSESDEVNKLLIELNSESKSIIGNMENLLRLTNGDLPIPFIYNISKEAQLQINKWKQNILTIREILNKNYKMRGGYKNNINMLKLSITNKIKLIQPKY
jgi:hypothetical protein